MLHTNSIVVVLVRVWFDISFKISEHRVVTKMMAIYRVSSHPAGRMACQRAKTPRIPQGESRTMLVTMTTHS